MKRTVLTLVLSLVSASPLAAQWLTYPTPGLPRTDDGKPDLSAPAPKTADGKPDLSGIWRMNGLGYSFDIFGDQKVDMLPWAQAVYDTRVRTFAKDSPDTNCLPAGPRAGLFGMDPVKFVQTDGLLLILYEDTPTRQIFLDGRPLPQDPNPTWMGYSVGHWESDTLVVQSTGFNDRTWLDVNGHPHTEALQVTERFRRIDTGHMRLDMTFDDPKTYVKPWTIGVDIDLFPDTELLENVCIENEKDRTRLVGHVDDEQAHAVKVSPATLAKYAGTYTADPIGPVRVAVDGDALAIQVPGGAAMLPALAKSDSDFIVPALGASLRFFTDKNDAVTHLRLTIVEGDIDAPRSR